MAEFNMDITNTSQYDNPAVLLASTNKLLDIVGIGAKQIQSIEELTRVASSMFVAIFETVFYARIEGAVRNPFSRSDYIKNAQLVIDNISRHIDIDLSHISGEDIVNGTVFALSFLVHIILGVVRITSRNPISPEMKRPENSGDRAFDYFDSESISTHESAFANPEEQQESAKKSPVTTKKKNNDEKKSETLFNNRIRQSLDSVRKLTQQEQKIETARLRKDRILYLKESQRHAANMKKQEISERIKHRKWIEDQRREKDAFALAKTSREYSMLRQIYKALLGKIRMWKLEESSEMRTKIKINQEQTEWQIQALRKLFEDRLAVLKESELDVSAASEEHIRSSRATMENLQRSIIEQQELLLAKSQDNVRQKRDYELIRRHEAHKNLLALLSAEDWYGSLRGDTTFRSSYESNKKYNPLQKRKMVKKTSATPLRRRSSKI